MNIQIGEYYSRPKGGYCTHLVLKIKNDRVYTQGMDGKYYDFSVGEFSKYFELEDDEEKENEND